MLPTKLLLVVPCYNEEEILLKTHRTLQEYYTHLEAERLIAPESKICFVNDGSRDRTWQLIETICQNDPKSIGIKLSRNFGHQSAILAGLTHYTNDYDCFITIDADLQDDIAAIGKMLEQHRDGAMVVYGVRDDRSNDSWFKRTTAESFYTMMRWMGVPVVFNHADFRLMDRRILEEFAHFKEVNLFLRGIIPLIGFRSEKVFYKRLEREAGETKYPLKKMLLFAWNGVTSFSTFPMRLVLYFGLFNFFIAMAVSVYIGISYLYGSTVAGWTSIVLPMTFFSGANMIAIGLIGEYVGKIYEEVKGRPRYIIEKVVEVSEVRSEK
ncbi:glycosyltransferase [Runella sp. CRIBMP]|uniref:glycosyltransferase family 2 protein n=1 Tax=Runella sp. CRIBMP TaxID=2683261 RepID=UPI00141305A7|nr:glycosyltransferase family 2 protein [Runella sp. CRIBMP]NBB19302.1 glycosyltransferase [Runella sp. CRIBMP]